VRNVIRGRKQHTTIRRNARYTRRSPNIMGKSPKKLSLSLMNEMAKIKMKMERKLISIRTIVSRVHVLMVAALYTLTIIIE
jgi:hypothetical protein